MVKLSGDGLLDVGLGLALGVVVSLLGLGFDSAGLGEVGFDVADDTLEDADNGFGDRGFGGNGDIEGFGEGGFGLDVFGLEEEDFFEESCDDCLEFND